MKQLVIYLSILTLAYSCTPETEILPTPVKVTFDIGQTLPAGDNNFFLEMTNAEPLECSNSRYLEKMDIDEGAKQIKFELNGVEPEGPCISAEADFVLVQQYNLPDETAEYTVEYFIDDADPILGKLRIDDEGIEIRFEDEIGFTFHTYRQKRIPEGIAWGYVNLETNKADIEKAYFNLLAAANAITPILKLEGDYGAFYANGDDQVTIDGVADLGQNLVLPVTTFEQWQQLQELLIKLQGETPDLKYAFWNSEGEQFQN